MTPTKQMDTFRDRPPGFVGDLYSHRQTCVSAAGDKRIEYFSRPISTETLVAEAESYLRAG